MFKEDSVEGILSVFNKTIEKLNALAVKKTDESNKLQDEASIMKIKADNASTEAKKAKEAASRISKIIGE